MDLLTFEFSAWKFFHITKVLRLHVETEGIQCKQIKDLLQADKDKADVRPIHAARAEPKDQSIWPTPHDVVQP